MEFWQVASFAEPDQLLDIARGAEEAGFHGLLLSDHLFFPGELRSKYPYSEDGKPMFDGTMPFPDPFTTIAAMAAVTTRLRFGTMVYILPLRHPLEVAKSVGTAAVLSGDRVVLGCGAGWIREEYDALGVDFATRGKRYDEMIDVLRKAWSGDLVEHRGAHFDLGSFQMSPAPRAPVPIWIGGIGGPALRRAAKRGDGWIGTGQSPDEALALLDAAARAAGEGGSRVAAVRGARPAHHAARRRHLRATRRRGHDRHDGLALPLHARADLDDPAEARRDAALRQRGDREVRPLDPSRVRLGSSVAPVSGPAYRSRSTHPVVTSRSGGPMSQTTDANAMASKGQAGADPYSVPLDAIDVSDPELFETDTLWGYFERLRKEDPVHYCANSGFGPYWSVTRYADIVQVEKNPEVYSSARSITVVDPEPDFPLEAGFITMDGAKHDAHRKVVQPVASPRNLAYLEPLIRQRVGEILDGLPVGETFDLVDRVSIELTTGMLATLFDFPYEERRKLTFWSEMATTAPQHQIGSTGATEDERRAALMECLAVFTALFKERQNKAPTERLDFVTALANADATRGLAPLEYLGELILLIVGGNDTTRNSISGGVVALNENPDEYQKLRDHRDLIPNMVSEIIRWQTPLAHMRRTATRDTETRRQDDPRRATRS